jgi:hemerythrin-like domain-containing protein
MDKLSVYLAKDHAQCEAMYLAALSSVTVRDWQQAALRFARFAQALTRHMAMEETVLFTAVEQATGAHAGPIQALRIEHQQLRGILQRLAGAIAQRHMIDFSDHADTFHITLQQHSLKEDGILYPLADRVLQARHAELIGQMTAFGRADGAAGPP